MMKHAYLILAHHEFELLQYLVTALDNPGNDIFIHIDKKVNMLPNITAKESRIHLLSKRIDVRWGDISVVEAEYALFEAAYKTNNFDYFHLISGVDIPIKSQDYIQQFFCERNGIEFIGFYQDTEAAFLERKMQRYHLFAKHLRPSPSLSSGIKRIVRALFLRLQIAFGYKRNKSINFRKGTQWVSITKAFVVLLLQNRENVMRTYHHTFCPDEVYKQTLCWNSEFRDHVYDLNDEGKSSLRAIKWKDGNLYDWKREDFDVLMCSEALFARKFNSQDMGFIKNIYLSIK